MMAEHELAQRITDMLCGAFEGGSNYWITKLDWTETSCIEDWDTKSWYDVLPKALGTNTHFEFMVRDLDGDWHDCDTKQLWAAVDVMSRKYYRHFRDMVAEQDDATTADVFIQCAIFGEVVYG